MEDRNTKIARQLVRIAKQLVAAYGGYDDSYADSSSYADIKKRNEKTFTVESTINHDGFTVDVRGPNSGSDLMKAIQYAEVKFNGRMRDHGNFANFVGTENEAEAIAAVLEETLKYKRL